MTIKSVEGSKVIASVCHLSDGSKAIKVIQDAIIEIEDEYGSVREVTIPTMGMDSLEDLDGSLKQLKQHVVAKEIVNEERKDDSTD